MAGIKISADVDDAAFAAFAKKFEEHKAALDALPSAWQTIAGAATSAHSEFDLTANALAKHAASAGEITKQTTQLTHVSGALSSHWKNLRLNTTGVATNISEMTKSLLSWSGSLGKIVGIGLGAGAGVAALATGGFWAMDKLGQGVGAKRMQAQGLGTSIGGVASFETAFARLGNTAQMLSGANVAKTDLSSQDRRALINLGITDRQIDTLSSDELAALEIQKLKEKSNSIKDDKLFYPQMAALGVDLDHSTLQTIRQTSNSELGDLERRRRDDKPLMNITDADAKKWVDFTTTVAEVTRTIKNKFEVRLSELGPSLERLSLGLGKAADEFIDKDLGPWIDGLADGLESLSKTVDSDTTKRVVQSFFDEMEIVAKSMAGLVHGLAAAARWLGIPVPGTALAAGALATLGNGSLGGTSFSGGHGGRTGANSPQGGGDRGGNGSGLSKQNKDKALDAVNYLMGKGWSREGAETAVGQVLTEDPSFALMSEPGGGDHGTAHGLFQWREDRYRAGQNYVNAHGGDSIHRELDFFDEESKKYNGDQWRHTHSLEEGNRLGKVYEGYKGGLQNRRLRDSQKLHDLNTAPPVVTKKVSIRNQPGGDIFAMGFGNVYGHA
jgi:Phage tail lysozyme